MLLYQHHLFRSTLEVLAGLLVEAGRLPAREVTLSVERAVARLASHFGKAVEVSRAEDNSLKSKNSG
jgi:hypothetical protein